MTLSSLNTFNPKQTESKSDRSEIFPYYAGYSSKFAARVLTSAGLQDNALVLDPWNGAGTTTSQASKLGIKSVGFDLNPVMIVAAKAALLSSDERNSLVPLARAIVEIASTVNSSASGDLLERWLVPSSARQIRSIEVAINRTLVCRDLYMPMQYEVGLQALTPLAAFFYASLFRATRKVLGRFIPTNPTWVRIPSSAQGRLRPSSGQISQMFIDEVSQVASIAVEEWSRQSAQDEIADLRLGNATQLALSSSSVDMILTSPPYCTRIDYAVATSIELAVLGLDESAYSELRRNLMGTSTVPQSASPFSESWGKTCGTFLNKVSGHPSKASKTYYLKSHLEYFSSLSNSVREMYRVTKSGGKAVVVVQDSFYKDVHNDVPAIVTEMMQREGFYCTHRNDYVATRSMVSINARARKYKSSRTNVESVLCFQKSE